MQLVLEIIGAIILIGLIALGVEKYIEFLKTRTQPDTQPDKTDHTTTGDKSA